MKYVLVRFVNDPKPSMAKYPVFQAGPRTCLGQDMAIFEASTVLGTIYKVRVFPYGELIFSTVSVAWCGHSTAISLGCDQQKSSSSREQLVTANEASTYGESLTSVDSGYKCSWEHGHVYSGVSPLAVT